MEEKIKQCPEFPFFGASYPCLLYTSDAADEL